MVVTQIKPTTQTTSPSSKNSTEENIISPPEHLFSDYIEIVYLGSVILTGLTLNFCVLKRLLIEKKMTERGGRPKVIEKKFLVWKNFLTFRPQNSLTN